MSDPAAPSDPAGFAAHTAAFAAGAQLRVVNFHATPAAAAPALRRDLHALARDHDRVGVDDLDGFFATGRWPTPRPRLLLAFYDGYRDGYSTVAPLLDEVGLTGWFFVCTGWVDTPPARQEAFAHANTIDLRGSDTGRDRIALSWDEVAELSRRHVVTPHTATHAQVVDLRTAGDVERELGEPKRRMDAVTGQDSPATAWLWGTRHGLAPVADTGVVDTGYRYVVSNTLVQRVAGA